MSSSGNNSNDDWCTIESDPGVFTTLLEDLGVTGVELSELWSLEDEALAQLGPVYGLIFLFQWIAPQQQTTQTDSNDNAPQPLSEDEIPSDLFFAHQVATNACATQALLSVVLNAPQDDPNLNLGPLLTEFQSFTASFPPPLKGVAIASSPEIQAIHNSLARPESFLAEGKVHVPTGDEEAFHFVAYVPSQSNSNKVVYELDGLQKGPLVVGSVPPEETPATIPAWLPIARTAIQSKMARIGTANIKFNCLAVVQDPLIAARAAGDEATLRACEATRRTWKLETQRRRHNYVPLCMSLLEELAKLGQLETLTKEAQERVAAKKKAAGK